MMFNRLEQNTKRIQLREQEVSTSGGAVYGEWGVGNCCFSLQDLANCLIMSYR